jgi:hypothetical protein
MQVLNKVLTGCVPVLTLLVGTNVQGQTLPNAYAGGLAALSIDSSGGEGTPAVGGSLGVRIAPGLFLTGEVGYLQSIDPNGLNTVLDLASDIVDATGLADDFAFGFDAPTLYVSGGLRFQAPTPVISPFVEGAVGYARTRYDVDVRVLGVEASPLADLALQLMGARYADGPVTTLGGGVTFFFTRHVGLDAGYRYMRFYGPDADTNNVYAAFKVGF